MPNKERRVNLLPSEWHLPLVSAWRTFERTLNPAFSFLIKCEQCAATGHPDITFVLSKKNDKAILGLECTKCLNTIKFEDTIDSTSEDFPEFLKGQGKPVLHVDGNKPVDYEPGDDYLNLMFE